MLAHSTDLAERNTLETLARVYGESYEKVQRAYTLLDEAQQNIKAWLGVALAFGDSNEEALANGKLISAAPELLEAMEYINKQIDKVFGYDLPEDVDGLMRGISDAVEEAIAKAKGVQP